MALPSATDFVNLEWNIFAQPMVSGGSNTIDFANLEWNIFAQPSVAENFSSGTTSAPLFFVITMSI